MGALAPLAPFAWIFNKFSHVVFYSCFLIRDWRPYLRHIMFEIFLVWSSAIASAASRTNADLALGPAQK